MLEKHHDSVEHLVSDFRDGQVAAFETVFHQFYSRLCAFSLKYVQSHDAAEEIVGDSFLVVWEVRDKFASIQSLKSYLYVTVRNTSLDYLKKRGKVVSLDIEISDNTNNMEFLIIEEETHSMLYQALNILPTKCRRVFEMSCLDGLKYQDIADEMQISLNTVKSQRARAIQMLKSHFKGHSFYTFFI